MVERRPLEQQADREVSAQRHREVPRRHAVGPLFNLTHDAGPSSQGKQFGAQIVRALIIGDTELGERMCDRAERAPLGGAVVRDEPWERSRPRAALCRKRRAVDLQEASVDAATPIGHGPMREALIEIARQESNERWMDPGIGVEAVDGPQPVAMPNRSGRCGTGRLAGAVHRLQTGVPEAVHRPPLLARAIVQLAERGGCGSGVRRHIGPKPRQRRGFFQDPRELSAGRARNAMQHDGAPEIEAGADASHITRAAGAQLFVEQRLDVLGENAARRQLVPVTRLFQERLASELGRRLLHRVLERQVLEGVQRIVVDEDADGTLGRQQMRQLIDHAHQGMVRWGGFKRHRAITSGKVKAPRPGGRRSWRYRP